MRYNHQSVHIEKPDFLSLASSIDPSRINGCKHCKKTIFWNGAHWNHANDKHACDSASCHFQKTGRKTTGLRGVWSHKWPHILGRIIDVELELDELECPTCNSTGYYYQTDDPWDVYGSGVRLPGRRRPGFCPARVATPAVTQGVNP